MRVVGFRDECNISFVRSGRELGGVEKIINSIEKMVAQNILVKEVEFISKTIRTGGFTTRHSSEGTKNLPLSHWFY